MLLHGHIKNGVVVFPESISLPDGIKVTVIVQSLPAASGDGQPVQLPLVPSKHPGSRPLTAERVAELLDEDDLSS